MALFGACAFGVVTGWLAVLIARPAQTVSVQLGWRAASSVLFGWACASALPWFYVGISGVLVAWLGIALGALTALAVFDRAHYASEK